MRGRVFYRNNVDAIGYACVGELEAADAEEIWRRAERDSQLFGRSMRPGDIVYISDLYLELNHDGGWRRLSPGSLTRTLHKLIPR